MKMINSIDDTVRLHNGIEIQRFGLGVYKIYEEAEVNHTVKTALQLGYRSIDTAAFYENEAAVGQAIRESGFPREEIFVTTKVWNSDQGYEETLAAFDRSHKKLGLDYIDLYLIHWPVKEKYLDTWRGFLEKLYLEGKVVVIGVSNFQIHHLQDLMEHSKEKPVINQVELHPFLSQEPLRAFCKQHGIAVEAWSPLGRARFLDEPVLATLAEKYKKTAAQIILRWHLQNDIVVIPKVVYKSRLKENSDIFDFELTKEDITIINELNQNKRFGADPDHFDF